MRFTPSEMMSNMILLNVEDLLDVVLTENGLCDRFADAAPSDAIVYHIGLLARDRDRVAPELPAERRADLDAIARRVWAMAEAGLGHLVQRRVAEQIRNAFEPTVRTGKPTYRLAILSETERRDSPHAGVPGLVGGTR